MGIRWLSDRGTASAEAEIPPPDHPRAIVDVLVLVVYRESRVAV
jgi:hypothetical protein